MDAKTIKELKALAKINAVGDAYEVAAEALGLTELAEQFKSINLRHLRAGYMTWELTHERHAVYEKMMSHAKAVMPDNEYKEFYKLF